MANSDEKVSKFVQAITQYAQEQREKIHQEVEDFKSEKLLAAEQEVLRDAYRLIQKERAGVRNSMALEMSKKDFETRQELLALRQDMMERVFRDAEQELRDWCGTPDYLRSLQESLKKMTGLFPAQGTTYSLCRRDEPLLEQLRSLCPQGSTLTVCDDIRLGGLRGQNRETGLTADDTLDTKLEEQRDWFTAHSGLTLN